MAGKNENKLLHLKVQNCRAWLSILRAAGRSCLFAEQQQMLGDLDGWIEEALGIADQRAGNPSAPVFWPGPEVLAERILYLVRQCLEDLNRGCGLSAESRLMLAQLHRAPPEKPGETPAE